MTRHRQKREGKRKGYGKFLPVRKAPGLISGVWVRGKFKTVEQMIESAEKAAGKEK